MAAVVILIGSVGFPSEGLGSATTRSASETALPDPFLPNANPWNLGYVSPGELLVFSAGLQSVTVPEPYWVWRLGPEGQLLGGWGPTGFPEPSTWVPETMAVDRTRRRVYFWASTAINRRRGPLVVFDTDRRYLDTWRWPYGMVGLSTWLRVAPDGSVYAVLSLPANPSSTHVDRWSTNGNFLGRWPGSLGTRQYGVHDFFVDETGRVVLIGPADTLQRFNPDGEAIDVLRLPHPPAIGPAILGNDIWVTGVDADHASASIVLTTSRSMQANHLARYSSEGTFQSAVPLWRYHQLQEPTHQAVAAGPDGLVALDWDPHSRIQPRPVRRTAITQWSSEVTIRGVTVFSGPHSQLEETWARARVSGGGVQHLLYPESAVIAQLDPEGHIIRQRVAPPFAMDIAADDDGYLAIRGWDGQHSRLSLWDPNQSTLWATDCPVSLATGLAIDRRFVYASDPVRRVVLAFRRADGQAVGSLGPAHASAGWPLDLAALSPGTLATLGQHGEIEIWTWQAGRVEPGASFRTHSSLPPLAMAATATSLAVLVSDRSIELFAPDGTLRDRWWLGPDRQPVDLTFLSPSTLLILDAARPSLVAYRVPDPSLPEPGQPDAGAGICQLTGDKLADPTRVAVGQPVTITLTLAAYCPPGPSLVNVVIVWSPKSSFWYRYDFARARELILWLVEALDRPPFRVAVVTVRPNTPAGVLEAEVGVPFDTPLPQALERLAGIARYDLEAHHQPAGWPDAIGLADSYLQRAARPHARQAIVLVADLPTDADLAAAAAARQRGVLLLALQTPFQDEALLPLLNHPRDLFFGAHATDVGRLAARLEAGLGLRSLRDLVVDDQLDPRLAYIPNSAKPPARGAGDRLRWSLAELPSAGTQFSYRVMPREPGRYPTNLQAAATYLDVDGTRHRFAFPQPILEVLTTAPTGSAPPATPAPSPSATSGPRMRLYLPHTAANAPINPLSHLAAPR